VDISPVPVTAKIRLGWDLECINVVETVKTLEKAGVSLIAIHARTRSMLYSGEPMYEYIKLAKESVNIPIIANGDINSLEDAKRVLTLTNADGVMIGRGGLGNPNLIKQLVAYFKNEEEISNSTLEERISDLKTHFSYLKELKGEYRTVSEMRGLSPHYLKGFKDSKKYRVMFSSMKSEADFLNICEEILKNNPSEQ
jgi:nifR3 family TIM-barrel protein